jgi:hypothetical protein
MERVSTSARMVVVGFLIRPIGVDPDSVIFSWRH